MDDHKEVSGGQQVPDKKSWKSWFSIDTISVYIFSALLFLLPIFFIPVTGVTLQFAKYLLLVLAVLICGGIWIFQRLKDGVFELPVNLLTLSGLVVLIVLILASLFSSARHISLIGQGFETDTLLFYVLAFLVLFLASDIFSTKRKIITIYATFFISVALVALFHIVRLAFPSVSFLSLGILGSTTDTLIGKWDDLAIFFGLGAILSLITIESVALSKRVKLFLTSILVVSLFFLAVINFSLIWYSLAVLSLVLFVYGVVMNRVGVAKVARASFPAASCVILIISAIFIFDTGGHIGNYLSTKLNVSQVEVRPTWQVTTAIAQQVIFKKSVTQPLFGIGPNRFQNAWALYKPTSINSTQFWNTDFNYGVGIVPSSLVTTGLLGFLSWVLFLAMLIYMGFRSILSKIHDSMSQYLVISSFMGALYLWFFFLVYVPSLVLIIFAFFFTGLFIASLTIAGILHPIKIEYFKNTKIGFISVLVLIILLISGIGVAYVFLTKFFASMQYNQSVVALNNGDTTDAQNLMGEAIALDPNDLYLRGLSQIDLIELNTLVNATSTPQSVAQTEFAAISQNAVAAAQEAVAYDPSDYQNWSAEGDVYAALVPFKVPNAYQNAVNAYNQVLALNPQNPSAYLQLARVDSTQNNPDQAKNDINEALKLKYDYADAYFFLAQIQIAQGDTKSAINSVTAAALSAQNNPGLFFQLGLLEYQQQDYPDAIAAFESAVRLNNVYANAKYYLGLSYYQVGRVQDAINQFKDVATLNPDSQEVQTIIANLEAGRAPLGVSGATADTSSDTATSTKKTTKK